jgi:hypothetical protein
MTRTPMTVAELVDLLVEAAQPEPVLPIAASPADEQVERILSMVAPELYVRRPLPHLRPLLLSRAELEALGDYSWTLPSGIWPGKRWRMDANDTMAGRRGPPRWMLCEAFAGPTDTRCVVRRRPITVRTTLADLEQAIAARKSRRALARSALAELFDLEAALAAGSDR